MKIQQNIFKRIRWKQCIRRQENVLIAQDWSACILLNDEGKLIGLEGNRRIGDDIIVGDFFVCGTDKEGNLTSLSNKDLELYSNIFYEPEEFTEEEIEESIKIDVHFF